MRGTNRTVRKKTSASGLSSQAFGSVFMKAGLLACDHRSLRLPGISQWLVAVRSHIQWRDRAGIAPASLLTHVLRHKHLHDCYSVDLMTPLYTESSSCLLHFFRRLDANCLQSVCECCLNPFDQGKTRTRQFFIAGIQYFIGVIETMEV